MVDETLGPRFAQTRRFVYSDELETEAGFNDFDIAFFDSFYRAYYKEEIEKLEISIEKLLENIKFLKNDKLTLSGLLLCGKSPERFRPQFGIKATYFEGTEISSQNYKDSEEIRGKLINQYTNANFFIKRNLRRVQKNRNVNAPGILEIPELTLNLTMIEKDSNSGSHFSENNALCAQADRPLIAYLSSLQLFFL